MQFQDWIREIPDFPKPGVLFRDLSPLLASAEAFDAAMTRMVGLIGDESIDAVMGIESRGFILGAALAARLRSGFIPMRKAGKLPPPVQSQNYQLEYGNAALEVAHGEGRVVIVDDVLATGGTLEAAIQLAQRAGYDVRAALVMIDLRHLNSFQFRGRSVPSLVVYDR